VRLHSRFMPLTPIQSRSIAWTAIALALVWLLWALGAVLTPFAVAAVAAYALAPLVARLSDGGPPKADVGVDGPGVPARGWGWPRWLAVLVVEALFLLLLAGVLTLLVPIVARELPLLREKLPGLFDQLSRQLQPWLARMDLPLSLDVAALRTMLVDWLNANWQDAGRSLLSSLRLGGSLALAVLGNLVLIPVALFYLLLDWDALMLRAQRLLPPRLRPAIGSFARECDEVLGQYLRGQLMVMGLMAVFYAAGLSLFGLDIALPVGVFTGLAMFVPYLGFGLGLLLALVAGLLQFGALPALVMVTVVFGLGQLIESFLLTPRLVGERIGLHPLAVIFALLAFGELFGVVGVLIALPASAVLLVALRRLRAQYLQSHLYRGT